MNYLDLQNWIRRQYKPRGVDANTGEVIYPQVLIRPYNLIFSGSGGTQPSFSAIAQNNISTSTATVQANADFVMTGAGYQMYSVAAALTDSTDPLPQARVMLTDTGSNDQQSNLPIPLIGLGASVQYPGVTNLPYPRWINGRSSVTAQLTNLAAAALTLDFWLIGVLVQTVDA